MVAKVSNFVLWMGLRFYMDALQAVFFCDGDCQFVDVFVSIRVDYNCCVVLQGKWNPIPPPSVWDTSCRRTRTPTELEDLYPSQW